MHEKVEVNAGATRVFPQEALGVGLLNCSLQVIALIHKLATDVNISSTGTLQEQSAEDYVLRAQT